MCVAGSAPRAVLIYSTPCAPTDGRQGGATSGTVDRMDDPYDLERFVTAQDRDGAYDQAVSELREGRKRTGWMWFVFPQLRGLGSSATAFHFGITSGDEASKYLAHDTLGPRLHDCARLVLRSGAASASALMGGEVNALKLKSSMTLFAAVAADDEDFVAVLRMCYHGGRDLETTRMLKAERAAPKVEMEDPPPTSKWWFRKGRRGRP